MRFSQIHFWDLVNFSLEIYFLFIFHTKQKKEISYEKEKRWTIFECQRYYEMHSQECLVNVFVVIGDLSSLRRDS